MPLELAVQALRRSCDIRHSARYLAAYEWRFNHRFDLDENLERLARTPVTSKPKRYHQIAAVRPKSADTLG